MTRSSANRPRFANRHHGFQDREPADGKARRHVPRPGDPTPDVSPSGGRGPRTGQDRLRRVLGQNFVADPQVISQIVRAARIAPDDLVLEVGAGRGRLTRALAARCGRIVAYEIDAELVARLSAELPSGPAVRLVHGDFVAARPPRESFAVVGNIPYASTGRIVEWCLSAPSLTSATLVTQLEYARKRTGDFGRWSRRTVLTWPWYDWRLAGRIPRERFRPAPRVDSAILRIARRSVPMLPVRQRSTWERFVELGFSGLGGTLRASLCREHPRQRVDAALRANRLAPETVVAYVWPEQWIALYQALHFP